MRTRHRIVLGVIALLAGLAASGLLAWSLDSRFAYHAPLTGAADDLWTPRQVALVDLAEAARRRAEAAARRAELLRNLTPDKMVVIGQEIVEGEGLCFNCHRVGDRGHGEQGPDLAGVGERAAERVAGLDATGYLAQSLYHPSAFIVDGYTAAMPEVAAPPIALDDLEILMVVAYLQSLGGEVTVTPKTDLSALPGVGP